MDDLDFLETALGSKSPFDSSALQDLEKNLNDCPEPPELDLEEVIATLDSLSPPPLSEYPPATKTSSSHTTPPHSPPKELSTSPAETRIDNALISLLRSDIQQSSKQEFFSALQSTLMKECFTDSTPDILIVTVQTPIPHSVALRDQRLQLQYDRLRQQYPSKIEELSSFHCYHAAVIETNRFKMLHHLHKNSPDHLKQMYNAYYDSMLHRMMERVENSLGQLEKKTPKVKKPAKTSLFKSKPVLKKGATEMMEEWYQSNVQHPYPSPKVVQSMSVFGGITEGQVRKWFANKRTRLGQTQKINKFKCTSV